MQRNDDAVVSVNVVWNDWRCAIVRLADLRDVHWHQPKGAPHRLLHAYLSCASVVHGDLPHGCDGASVPHQVRVVVLKKHNLPAAYAELLQRADGSRRASDLPSSVPLQRPSLPVVG